MVKVCTKCKIPRSFFDFHQQENGMFGLRGCCIDCNRAYQRAAKERINVNERKRLEDPEKKEKRRRSLARYRSTSKWILTRKRHQVKKYGLTLEDYLSMHRAQNGRCKICDKKDSEEVLNLCVDHDHDSGKVRGLLCDFCNTSLGFLKDDPDLFVKAAKYILDNKGVNI